VLERNFPLFLYSRIQLSTKEDSQGNYVSIADVASLDGNEILMGQDVALGETVGKSGQCDRMLHLW
jgi:hypothetical protein